VAAFRLRNSALHRASVIVACVAGVAGILVAAAAGGARLRHYPVVSWHLPTTGSTDTADEEPATAPTPVARPAPTVTLSVDGKFSWAFLDRATGTVYSSENASTTSYTESMVKAWLAADSLSRSAAAGRQPNLNLIVPMILDSDDNAAETIYLNNGADATIRRMIQTCHLANTTIHSYWWSLTMMSARDAVQLGKCIADGTAAGPQWTNWLLDEMRKVRGEGRFGIIDGVNSTTAATLAIKNGWTLHVDDGKWHVNCLAIDNDWVLAVMLTYPGGRGLGYGASACANVAKQVLGPKQVVVPPGG
jgi:hypothetical protein